MYPNGLIYLGSWDSISKDALDAYAILFSFLFKKLTPPSPLPLIQIIFFFLPLSFLLPQTPKKPSHRHLTNRSNSKAISDIETKKKMQDIFDSVRRSLVFRSPEGEEGREGSLADKISSCLRRSRVGFLSKSPAPSLTRPPLSKDTAPPIRWRRGELIGCGAFGRVYMGMNLDSGELLAVKQVLFNLPPFCFL